MNASLPVGINVLNQFYDFTARSSEKSKFHMDNLPGTSRNMRNGRLGIYRGTVGNCFFIRSFHVIRPDSDMLPFPQVVGNLGAKDFEKVPGSQI